MISIIISHYNNVPNLTLILDALNKQSVKDFEAIVSEDGSDSATALFLKNCSYAFPIQHNTQVDEGFRKNRILNTSIKTSKGDFLVFIDGDCIPHRHFVKAYEKVKNKDAICYGRRVMLSKKISEKLLHQKCFNGLSMCSLLTSNSKKVKESIYSPIVPLNFKERGLKGCNWGIKKEILNKVNGFDEAYVYATVGEDDDIEWRLKGVGVEKYSMKNKAITYHLHHKRTYFKNGTEINQEIMKKNQLSNQFVCLNGLNKFKH